MLCQATAQGPATLARTGRAYRLRRHIEDKWDDVLKEDPEWVARSPLVLVAMAAIAAAAVIVLGLILG